MGSVLDFIECPNCKHEAFDDFYYKTGEEYIGCNNCGYHKSATIINRDKLLTELTEEDWEVVEIKEPYGAFRIKRYEDLGTLCGTLESEEHLNELKQELEKDKEVEYFTISQFIDGEIKTTNIIGNELAK